MITRLGFASAAVMNAPEQHSNKADTRANATVSIFILDLLAEHCLQSGEHMPMVSFGNDSSTAPGGENRNFDTPVAGFGKFCHWMIATGAAAMTFEEAMEYALTLPGAERSASYGRPCVKANGSGFLFVGHEPQDAFALHMEMTTKQIVLETHPETFFQTAHYAGHPIVLVRYDASDDDLIREMIRRAADWARAKVPPRPRKKRRLSRKL